jgi:hypothetical protein
MEEENIQAVAANKVEINQNSKIPAHNIFIFDENIIFSSNFDNGNLAKVERIPNKSYEFRIWTAPDNMVIA